MHVMIVPSWYENSRNKVHGSFFREQAEELQKKGVKVTIAYNEIWPLTLIGKIKEKSGLSYKVENGLKTYRYKNFNYLPKNSLMFFVFNKRLEKIYKSICQNEGKVDVIHAHSCFWAGISASYVAKKYNVPLVITEHSSMEKSHYIKKSYKPYIINAYRSSNKLIAVSDSLKRELENICERNDILTINNLVNMNLYKKDQGKNKEFIFFSLAFLEGEKGFDTLLPAFAERFKGSNVKLVIGGDGSQRKTLEEMASTLNINRQVEFLGILSREKVGFWMNKCDCFVLPSKHETFGVVYIEALSCGKPVIGAFNGGAEEIIKKENGFIVPVDDVNELAEKMDFMVKHITDFSEELIRKDCIERYSPDIIINKIINVYKELIGG